MTFLTAREALPPREIPLPVIDPYVFGGWAPNRDPVPHHGRYRWCDKHHGIDWYGPSPCWVCEPGQLTT